MPTMNPLPHERVRVVVEFTQTGNGPMVARRLLVNGEPVTVLTDDTVISFRDWPLIRFDVSFAPESIEFVRVAS